MLLVAELQSGLHVIPFGLIIPTNMTRILPLLARPKVSTSLWPRYRNKVTSVENESAERIATM